VLIDRAERDFLSAFAAGAIHTSFRGHVNEAGSRLEDENPNYL
jgi:hypothetical protein